MLLSVVPLLSLLALGACAGNRVGLPGVAAAPPAPTDPLLAFAAAAQPGSASRIVLANGQPAEVRLLRSYDAASGRSCREVLVGTGTTQRSQVVCQTEAGGWASARPLLRGSGLSRP